MKTQKVLIIDDEPMIRWVMTEAVKSWGFVPVSAENTMAARELFEQGFPDAVLLDINLPDGSGLDLLRQFKKMRPQTPVVIISGEVIVENTIEALRGGADDFIAKPIDMNEVRMVLENKLSAIRHPRQEGPAKRPKVLIVTDSSERSKTLRSMINSTTFEIETASSQEEFDAVCGHAHDLAIVDLSAAQLRIALPKLRGDVDHTDIPVLVSLNRIAGDPNITGLLPQYRAMPCSPSELAVLMQRRSHSVDEIRAARRIL
jgi:DNA-binding response OmpR family regulator